MCEWVRVSPEASEGPPSPHLTAFLTLGFPQFPQSAGLSLSHPVAATEGGRKEACLPALLRSSPPPSRVGRAALSLPPPLPDLHLAVASPTRIT